MEAVNLFFLVFIVAVYVGCAMAFLTVIPVNVETVRWKKVILWGIYGVLCVILPNIWRDDMITVLILGSYYLAVGWFFYHRSRSGLFYQLIFIVGSYMAQMIGIVAALGLYSIFKIDNQTFLYIYNICKIFFLTLVTFGLWKMAGSRLVQEEKNLKIRGAVLIPICSMILIFMYILGAGEIFFIRYGYEWLVVYCVLCLVINAYCLYVWYDVAANRELKYKLELMQQQSELTHQYYEELEKNYSASRKIIHDIRNHLDALERSVQIGDKAYIQDVHGMLNSLGLKYYSENRMVNIVLNDKLKQFPLEQVECNMGGVSLDFLSDLDITTIFANLLDNAGEAAKEQDHFYLKIRADQIQDFTILKIWNFYEGPYQPGRSRKEGHEGLGLKNVEQAVKKYNGEMKIGYKQNIFSVTMVFPGESVQKT